MDVNKQNYFNYQIGCFLVGIALLVFADPVSSLGGRLQTAEEPGQPPVVSMAVMCEQVEDQKPRNTTIVFSVSQKTAYCFTAFEEVADKEFIFHSWYYRDTLSTKIKLMIQPPKWSTYSGIHFREADIGPWRVEVVDQKGRVLKTIRFSITE